MKKIFLIILFVACKINFIAAQRLIVQPNATPGKIPLPTPKIVLQLPDLNVSAIRFVEGHKDAAAGKYFITLNLTINNAGAANAKPCKLSLVYQRESTHGFYYASATPELNFASLNGKQSVSGNYTFPITLSNLGLGTYSFPVKVFIDCFNDVKESNEDNNMSEIINVTVHI